MLPEHDRRTFLTALGSAAALDLDLHRRCGASAIAIAPAGGVDITWFDAFKGKHKQVFDLRVVRPVDGYTVPPGGDLSVGRTSN